ncbi:hypothetical protein KEM55_006487 [Ascosphaera atra]|nr:hypothetical protein KEM55_006487 [Ascosphaera atra]
MPFPSISGARLTAMYTRNSKLITLYIAATPVASKHKKSKHRETKALLEDSRPQRYTAKAKDPAFKLNSRNDYEQWVFALCLKFEDDSPLFPSDAYKIRYALNHLEGDTFQNMANWIRDRHNKNPKWSRFQEELESFLGVQYLASEARAQLETACQDRSEDVSSLFMRMNKLWHHASTPTEDRIRQFCRALSNPLFYAMSAFDDDTFESERDFLNKVRSIEHNRATTRPAAPQNITSSGRFRDPSRRGYSQTSTQYPRRPNQGQSQTASSTINAASFAPCATRPSNWQGPWYDPQTNPPKISSDAERIQLRKEGRCYRCRGSGHTATHPICPSLPSNRTPRSTNSASMTANTSTTSQDSAPVKSPPTSEPHQGN